MQRTCRTETQPCRCQHASATRAFAPPSTGRSFPPYFDPVEYIVCSLSVAFFIQGGLGLFSPFERPPIGERSSVGLNFKPACRNGRFHPEKAPAFAPCCRGGGGRCSLSLPWLPGRARVCKLWGLPVPRCCLGPSRSVLSCTSPVQGGSRAFLENAAELDCRTWPMGEAK